MSLASLAMYSSPAPVAEATRLFWLAPEVLDDGIRYDEAWLRPDLLFGVPG
jgi:hypothetical protein